MESSKAPELKRVPPSRILGRGGAALTLWSDSPDEAQLVLASGASREQLFSDFWLIKIDKKELRASDAYELPIENKDGFAGRNSMSGIYDAARSRILYFGGVHSQEETIFNDILILTCTAEGKWTLTKHVYPEGSTLPPVRNSHTLTLSKDGASAYLFGGANTEGPLDDLWRLDLETLTFTEIKISGVKLPKLEMHTAHIYKDYQLLIVGGRGIKAGKT